MKNFIPVKVMFDTFFTAAVKNQSQELSGTCCWLWKKSVNKLKYICNYISTPLNRFNDMMFSKVTLWKTMIARRWRRLLAL